MLQRVYCDTAYEAIEELSKDTTENEIMTILVSPGLTLCRKCKNNYLGMSKVDEYMIGS